MWGGQEPKQPSKVVQNDVEVAVPHRPVWDVLGLKVAGAKNGSVERRNLGLALGAVDVEPGVDPGAIAGAGVGSAIESLAAESAVE